MPLPSYTQDSLQMLWLATYLTGFPPAGLYALNWAHGQTPLRKSCADGSVSIFRCFSPKVLIRTKGLLVRCLQSRCFSQEVLLFSPLQIIINQNQPSHICSNCRSSSIDATCILAVGILVTVKSYNSCLNLLRILTGSFDFFPPNAL